MVTGYLYPWDAPDAARLVGADTVALAAAYHSTRAGTPRHPSRRTVTAEHAAYYLPVRPGKFGRLVPHAPRWTEPDAYARTRDALRADGVAVHAWLVLTHSTILGSANRDLVVRNAYGETYEYALCPAAEAVSDYCAAIVSETVELGEPDGVVLEACGPLGVDHGGHHDKLDFAGWTPPQRQLLSLCFCAACAVLYADAGIDPAELASIVRAAFDRGPDSVEEALGEHADTVKQVRLSTVKRLRTRLVSLAGDLPVTLHGTPDPWHTGPFATVADGELDGVRTVVVTGWGEPAAARRDVAAVRDLGVRTGVYLRPDTGAGAARDTAGADELHLYHLGLLPETGLLRLADLVPPSKIGGCPS